MLFKCRSVPSSASEFFGHFAMIKTGSLSKCKSGTRELTCGEFEAAAGRELAEGREWRYIPLRERAE